MRNECDEIRTTTENVILHYDSIIRNSCPPIDHLYKILNFCLIGVWINERPEKRSGQKNDIINPDTFTECSVYQ